MGTDELLLNTKKSKEHFGEQNTIKIYHKSTRLTYVLVICRDALCSNETNKEKLDLTSEFWVFFIFQQGL